jgi:hypothetical protein
LHQHSPKSNPMGRTLITRKNSSRSICMPLLLT